MPEFKNRLSLYLTLALTIMLSVLLVLAIHARKNHSDLKTTAIEQMKINSTKTIEVLRKNVANDIESYTINEYDKLVYNEMRSSNHLAIVIKDYNMGRILDQKAFISGKIRINPNTIIDYNQYNSKHKMIIQKAFFSQTKDIISSHGKVIGKISVYISDEVLNKKLNELIHDLFVNFLTLTIILSIILFSTIYYFILKPVSVMSKTLSIRDENGIPTQRINSDGPKEISSLAKTINFMLDSIKKSQLKIQEQNKEIVDEHDRFELAVEGTEDGLWDWNIPNNTLSFSDRFYTMFGYEKEDLPRNFEIWSYLIHPEDREKAIEAINLYLNNIGKTKYENSFRMRKKNDAYIWVTSRGKALFDINGKPLRFVGFVTDITKQVEHNKELEYTSKHDILTDLPNRFLFSDSIQKLLNKTKENNTHLALLYIDLDGFKAINDKFGHSIGDAILIKTAQKLKNMLTQEDIVARLGGDEFVVALSNVEKQNSIIPFLNNTLEVLAEEVTDPDNKKSSITMTASIGTTFYPQEKEIGPEALLRQANQAVYDAKNLGKNQYHIFNVGIDSSVKEHLHILQDFEQSLKNKHFELYYQPKADMPTNKIIGFETLLRWNHPEKGLLYPDQFLPQVNAEKQLMLSLGEWVISSAFEQLSLWIDLGYDFALSINISAHEFKESKTFKLLNSLLEKYPQIDPNKVEFEILETHAFDDLEQANIMIKTFQDLGFNIALDDFGTGYSTLSYLKDFSINTLKIDKSFVKDMLHDRASLSILEATLGLADAFGCEVIAEGVESVEHGNILIQLGCDQAQGYVLSRPMQSDKVINWLESFEGHKEWEETSKRFFSDNSTLYATVEHREWVKNLKKYLEGSDKNISAPELDEHKCVFSKWLNNEAKKHFSEDTVKKITSLHEHIHILAKEAIEKKDNNKDDYMVDILKLHVQITNLLDLHSEL